MNCFFGAANTENGFFSVFDEIFSPEVFRRIYILKGGPGTGKSTFLRAIGAEAEKRGFSPEYIICSSDPRSLDGVILPELSAAIFDGTAPHTAEALYPGAVEQTIHLEDAFDISFLQKKREVIRALLEEKKKTYASAYQYLSAAGVMEREKDGILSSLFLEEKADGAIGRLLSFLHEKQKGKEKHRYLSAITGEGLVRLDTLWHRAKKIYAVTDFHGLGYFFMQKLYRKLSSREIGMTVCADPLMRIHTEAIFLEKEEILFVVSKVPYVRTPDKIINSERFVCKEALSVQRKSLRCAEKCEAGLLQGAYDSLARATAFHRKAEAIYGSAVDFSKVDAIREKFLSEIFANNM